MKLAMTNARVFDGNQYHATATHTLFIEDGIIVGLRQKGPIPTGYRVLDLNGMTLLPGFIDLHVHLGMYHNVPDQKRYQRFAFAKVLYLALQRAREALFGGVTTMREVGGRLGEAVVIRDAIHAGVLPGPNLYTSGDSITFTGGHAFFEADGEWALRKAVRQQFRAGADLIKIGQSDDFDRPGFTTDELRALCDEVHRVGKRLAVHIDREPGYAMAVEAGVDTVEHGFFPAEQTLDRMGERGTYWVPTISINRGMRHDEHTADRYETVLFDAFHHHRGWSVTESKRRARIMREAFEAFPRCFARGLEKGIKIVTGTDVPLAGLPMDAVKNEIIKFVHWGMTPEQALAAGTSLAAEALGVEADIGVLSEGKRADVIVLAGDPIADIEAIDQVKIVVKDGTIVRDDLKFIT